MSMDEGSGVRVSGSWDYGCGLGLRVQGPGFRIQGGFRVQGSGFKS